MPQPAESADLISSFNILKSQYPEAVNKLMAGGATEDQIKSFLRDVQEEINNSGILTESNFDSMMFSAVQEVITWPIHRNVFDALLNQYGTEVSEMLATKTIPAAFQPMRDALKSSLLGTSPGPVTPPGGGGGGGGGAGNNAVAANIAKQLESGVSLITLYVSSGSITIPGKSMQAVRNANLPIEISFGNHIIFLPDHSWPVMSDSSNLYFTCTVAGADRNSAAISNLSPNKVVVGSVMEINCSSDDGGFNFSKDFTVSLSYKGENLSGINEKTLDIAYYNEAASRWESRNAFVDGAFQCVTFSTSHLLSLYAIIGDKLPGYNEITEDPIPLDPYPLSFTDIAGHWAEQEILRMTDLGFINGMSPTEFAPNRNVTRAEFAALLVRILAIPATTSASSIFGDVAPDAWYFSPVVTAAESGLVTGITSTEYVPDDNITREQMAVMVARALSYKSLGRYLSSADIDSILQNFTDGAEIADWSKNGIATAYDNGIVQGRDDGSFDTQSNATRAEAVTMLARIYDLLK